MGSKKRSIVKSVTFRICATLTTMFLVWIYFGNLALAFSLGVVETIVKLFIYYVHERAWEKIEWEKK